ncbi:hypothetical protein DAERI_020291 [Deinococcus aerius]|uniref:Uncharacterized protein n=2 Tax=Deinococcus TaxID=1298 RepID=A0A2I9CSP4_9DEIO|nr:MULTISPECIES: hypothetical protein [Deinococcus]MBB5293846.1 hypothetical protein [Deinococcus metallilatus]GBF04694.1 hypothetical protein DAERI_020291 [Deinococcus aerius]GMA17778.1 hypothetical protein GCM10025871_41090 [Deinococcus metallilatus]
MRRLLPLLLTLASTAGAADLATAQTLRTRLSDARVELILDVGLVVVRQGVKTRPG